MNFSANPIFYIILIIFTLITAFVTICLAGLAVNLIMPLKRRLKRDGLDREDRKKAILRLHARQKIIRQRRKERKESIMERYKRFQKVRKGKNPRDWKNT